MKKKSFIRRTIIMMSAQITLLAIILLLFLFFSYNSTVDNINQVHENFLQVYGSKLENKIENADRLLEQLVYKNSNFNLLQSKSESKRYFASIELYNQLDEFMLNNNYVDMMIIAEREYQTCLDAESTSVSVVQRTAIREFALECSEANLIRAEWGVKEIGETPYVYKMYVWHGLVAGIFISADSFMETSADSVLEDIVLLLADESEAIWGCYGNEMVSWKQGMPAYEMMPKNTLEKKYMLHDGKLWIYSYVSMNALPGQIQLSMIVLFIIISISLMFTFLFVTYIRKEVLNPMDDLKDRMKNIQDGDYQLRMEGSYVNNEFEMLKNTFNKLMDEILGLKIRSYEKQIELQKTELKCIRLQIRPHFFLNAMTTISSLSMQAKNKEIKDYIAALSKNIRYMFKSGLHTVALKEEMLHLENYFEMQELKYPGYVFHYVDMEPGLGDWQIPQMLIHTVIENEYKYAVSPDSMLTILINVSKAIIGEEELLSIEIETDGKGYPQEVIECFNGDAEELENDGSRIGLWSVRRIMELMYEKKNLFQISNIEPHGCMNRFLIPANPVHVVDHVMIQNKID